MLGSVSHRALLVVTPWRCSCYGGGTRLVADHPKRGPRGCGELQPNLPHCSSVLLCWAYISPLYDYGFGERPRGASSVCMRSTDSTYRVSSVSRKYIFMWEWSCLWVPFQILCETSEPCGAAHQPVQWGISGEPWHARCSPSYPHPRYWVVLVQMLLLLWLHFPTCAMQRVVQPSSVKHTEIKEWRVLYNCRVSLFTHALVGWKALYETQRMNYYYISFQLFIAGIPPSSFPATSEAACTDSPCSTRGSRGRSSGLVSLPGCPPSMKLHASSGGTQPTCNESPATRPDHVYLSALQERSLTGYLAWRKGAEQTTSLHRMTPAGPLTTPSGWKSSEESSFLPRSPSEEASVPRVPLTQKTARHGPTQCAQHSCNHPSSPPRNAFSSWFLAGGDFSPWFQKPHGPT